MIHNNEVLRTILGEHKLKKYKKIVICQQPLKTRQILTSIDRCLGNVTNSGSLYDVSDNKLLDRLILWNATCTVGASDWLDVPTVVFTTSSITAFLGLFNKK